jgi:hypothetical protein
LSARDRLTGVGNCETARETKNAPPGNLLANDKNDDGRQHNNLSV